MRRYRFEKLLPESEELPPTSNEYLEMETAKAFGYRWSDWLEEDPNLKAKMMAHELHKAQREAYYRERVARAGDRPRRATDVDPLEVIKRQWGISY